MKASQIIRMLKKGIAIYGDMDVEITLRRSRTRPTQIRVDDVKRRYVILTEEDEYEDASES